MVETLLTDEEFIKSKIKDWILINFVLHLIFIGGAFYTVRPISSGSDGHWYVDIAQHGYNGLNVVFSPLYPVFIRIFSFIFVNFTFSAFFITLLGSIFYMIYFIKLSLLYQEQYFNQITKIDMVDISAILAIFFSYAWFQLSYTPTSESVMMPLLISSIYYLEKNEFGKSLILVFLAGFSRLTFVLILPFYFFKALDKNLGFLKSSLICIATSIGFIIQHLIALSITGSIFGIEIYEKSNWGTYMTYPFSFLVNMNSFYIPPIDRLLIFGLVIFYLISLINIKLPRYRIQGLFLVVFLLSLSKFPFYSYGFDRQSIAILAGPFYLLQLINEKKITKNWTIVFIIISSIIISVWITIHQGDRSL